MDYVPVLGAAPTNAVFEPVKHYFSDYLISIAEPTTSRSWSLFQIHKQLQKIMSWKDPSLRLYLDSGGYQILVGYIAERRIREYTDVYHTIIKSFYEDIDRIFSLDINSIKFSQDKLFKYNHYSIEQSLKLHEKYPDFKDKQLFVVQSRRSNILNDWLQLMDDHSVSKYYQRYSFGGLVSLKKDTRATFNHFVPMTLWLLTYVKNRGGLPLKQIHMLGQSSRIALITGAILEKLFNIEITMDSSEIIRFTPIAAKVPFIHQSPKDNEYQVITNLNDMVQMIEEHSADFDKETMSRMKLELLDGKVSNQTFVELVSQNLTNTISFAHYLTEQYDVNDIVKWDEVKFREVHPIFKIGRLAKEMAHNMRHINELLPLYKNGDFQETHKNIQRIIDNYYV
jgi:hypothetical protein